MDGPEAASQNGNCCANYAGPMAGSGREPGAEACGSEGGDKRKVPSLQKCPSSLNIQETGTNLGQGAAGSDFHLE
jgi:hypothetical protein